MYGNILARCGGSGSVSNGCSRAVVNTITSRSSSSSTTSTRRSNNNRTIMAATTSAGAACTMCHSLRITAACSAGTSLQQHVRTNLSNNHSNTTTARFLTTYNNKGQNHFGNGMNQTVAWNSSSIANGYGILGTSPTLLNNRVINSSSQVKSSSLLLPSSTFTQSYLSSTAAPLSTVATTLSSQEALLNGESSAAAGSSWTMQELVGAILFATAATAGSILLGPIDRLRGKTTGNNGGGGSGNGGGDNGSGGGSGGGPIGEHRLDSPLNTKEENKEEGDQEMELGLGVATLPRPYEVSVRALRGGRLSMEDEFVVVNGGRLSAVFDGHGGGGVSQYLRDRLHVIISEQLQQQERAQKPGKFKRMLKGLSGNKKRAQSEEGESTQDTNQSSKKYDISRLGQLPIHSVTKALKNSFDQIDKEILKNDEYEYQGSTAVATVLHEASDGTRTLLSANVGDSRAVLSRKGRAVELTRDHKPNDDREKARILAMGEKIEWDHYCKVHRVRNLSLSRAVGDRFAKPAVSGEVEIKRFPIYDDKDEFILLASDGLWDVLSSQEVVSYVHKRLKAPPKDGATSVTSPEDMASLTYLRRKNMSRFIANEALRRGSGDNISVVIVWLNEFDDGNPTV